MARSSGSTARSAPAFLDQAEPFDSVEAAQAAIDVWVEAYNTDRPHQGLDERVPVTPAQRFAPVDPAERDLVDLWLPPALQSVTGEGPASAPGTGHGEPGSAVEIEKKVPGSGNISVGGQQFWLGSRRAGQLVRFWIDCDMVHMFVDGTRIKTVRSNLSVTDLAKLVADGAQPAGPPPLPSGADSDGVVEVERVVSRAGTVTLGGTVILAAEILAGRQVGIRIEGKTLLFSTSPAESYCAPDQIRSRRARPAICAACARSAHHRALRPSRSPCSAECPAPGS